MLVSDATHKRHMLARSNSSFVYVHFAIQCILRSRTFYTDAGRLEQAARIVVHMPPTETKYFLAKSRPAQVCPAS